MQVFQETKDKFKRLSEQLNEPSVTSNPAKLKELSQEYADIKELAAKIELFEKRETELVDAKELLNDSDMRAEAEREVIKLEKEIAEMKNEIEYELLPKDPRDKKNAIVEIRAGAGGDESALFVAELLRMYSRYAESRKLGHELISANRIGIGGFKEVIFEIKGKDAYKTFKYESGVHRVQRVPETEKSGRVHTSTVTVAVMPQIEQAEININPEDLRIDIYRASGAGGQHVNKTESAVRITHIPTGIVTASQSERSQHKNKDKAMSVLAARIADFEEEKRHKEEGDLRRSQIGTGDRSEKIRTYNFPQGRVTDHRIKYTTKDLSSVMEGKLDPLLIALADADKEAKLKIKQK